MKPQLLFVLLAACAVIVRLCVAAPGVDPACDATELVTLCAGAINGTAAPTAACCNELTKQLPCLCQYASIPNLQLYVNSTNAACNVTTPTCSIAPAASLGSPLRGV